MLLLARAEERATLASYSYDDIGRVTAQNDYHGYDTAYTYTTRDQLSTITAPGSKTWDFDYNALGQPVGYTHPNGIATNYLYDTRNRMTKIEHLDGTTALESFAYALDAGGLITRTTEADGSYWDYAYDNRYRLTSAHLKNSGGTIDAPFTYTYDGGDNMLTKVEPFFDDFNDGNYTGWYMSNGTWSASNNVLSSTGTGAPIASLTNTDADNEVALRYRIDNTSDSLTRAYIYPRFTDWSNHLWVRIFPGSMDIYKIVGGTATQLASVSTTSTQGTWYNLRIVCDGNNMDVYRWADGNMPTKILSSTSATYTSTSYFKIVVQTGFLFSFDDIRVLANSLSNTTTFAVNNSNELTGMTDYNGTTSFAFDGWGRMTSKSLGSYSATYGYKYGQMLCSVTSNFPAEGNVTNKYGGNIQRRERTANSTTTKYNWNHGFGLISEEDNSGNLTRSYTRRHADVSGSNPATGSYRYYHSDKIGSLERVTDDSRSSLATMSFSPYGAAYSRAGVSTMWSFATLADDTPSGMLFAPYRYYAPTTNGWLSRDPLGFVDSSNLFAYVAHNPINRIDYLGADSVTIGIGGGFFGQITIGFNGNGHFYIDLSGGAGSGLYGSYNVETGPGCGTSDNNITGPSFGINVAGEATAMGGPIYVSAGGTAGVQVPFSPDPDGDGIDNPAANAHIGGHAGGGFSIPGGPGFGLDFGGDAGVSIYPPEFPPLPSQPNLVPYAGGCTRNPFGLGYGGFFGGGFNITF